MTPNQPKTIQIFLPTGDPTGIRIAEQTTSIMRVIEVPRRDLPDFLTMDESKYVGLYFLVGGENKTDVYVGQSSEVGRRLMQHHQSDEKDWERALILISLTQNLTQTHVLYLEYLSIEKAKACHRVKLINGNNGQRPYVPIPLQADCEQIHNIGALLLATLGYPFFEPLLKKEGQSSQDSNSFFVCPRNGVDARAIYTNEGMVVLKDSNFPYMSKDRVNPHRFVFIKKCDDLIEQGILRRDGERCFFTQDYLFSSPSSAAGLLILNNVNGWKEFKTLSGTTLRDYQENN